MGTTFSCMVVVEAINCLSTKTNSPNFIFVNYDFSTISKNELKNLLIFSKNFFRQISRSFILCVQRNNLTEYKVFFKKIISFLTVSGQLEGFQGKLFDKLLKRKSTCQDEHFLDLYLLPEQTFFQIFFGNYGEMSAFPWKPSTWSSKLRSTSPNDSLKRLYNSFCPKLFIFCGVWDKIFQLSREKFQQVS